MAMANWMDAVSNGLLGQPQNYGGLLSDEDQKTARSRALTSLGAALLQNSGPSTQPRSLGQILGSSIGQGQQAQDQGLQAALQAQLMKHQMQNQKKDLVTAIGADGNPTYVEADKAVGMQPVNMSADAKPAATIQEWTLALKQGYKGSFIDFQRDLATARTQATGTVSDVGGVPNYVRTKGAGAGTATALTTLPEEASGQAMVAGAKKGAEVTTAKTAEASFDLPRVEQNTQQAIDDIEKLKNHPGLPHITGMYSKLPVIPGTQQASADALAKQIQGQTFLQAYQTLKGGGAITEVEGSKAEAALARLQRAQSTEDYQAALGDLESVLTKGLKRAQQQAGGASKGGVKRIKVDAQGNVIGN